ncbi:uncharacterized protein [Temnothorax longispinosus]|uniref:uncharacterized protein isoform X2 n=1 Tax=Temnothorax longispinosus TaxID=300112 RepID=UPI003A991B4B
MICLETQHFNVNRILLLAVGLWPYQRSRVVELQFILLLGILITFIIFQFTTFLTSKCTPEHVLKIISTTFFFTCYVIKYNSFWINADIIKSSLDRLQDVCNELRDEKEIAILKKYGNKAKRYTTAIILIGTYGVGTLTAMHIWTYIQHIGLPKNESRLNPSEYFMTEYFIDQEKYFYLITLHVLTTIYIGAVSMMATGTMLVAYLQHICGIFGIASYRIEQAINILQKNILKSEDMVYKEITYAVDIHRKAMDQPYCARNYGSQRISICHSIQRSVVHSSVTYTENNIVSTAKRHETFLYKSRWNICGVSRKCGYADEYFNILFYCSLFYEGELRV